MLISRVSDDGDLVRLRAEGRIVQEGIVKDDPINRAVGPECYRRCVLLDLSGSSHVGSSGLSWLVASRREFESAGGRLILHSAPPVVSDVIKIMRLDRVLELAETERDAVAMARGGST